MARLFTFGYETKDISAEMINSPATAAKATETSIVRTGTDGFDGDYSGGIGAATPLLYDTGVSGRQYFTRFYFQKTSDPAGSVILFSPMIASGAINAELYVRLNVTGTVSAFDGVTALGTSAVLNNGQWYRIEFSWTYNTAAGADDLCELLIDGSSIVSSTRTTVTAVHARLAWQGNVAAGVVIDDVAVNDNQGASQNSWPGAGKVVLLKPISDNQDGGWRGGANSTGIDLSLGVTNTPPAGLITGSATNTTQIESIVASEVAGTEYRANMTTYSSAGLVSGDTISVVQSFLNHGEDVATGTKTGLQYVVSNPAGATSNFTFGNDIGAVGTFPTNWRTTYGDPIYSPSPTLGTSPVMGVRKTDAGTRAASVDFMGIYVDYVPAVAANGFPFASQAGATLARL